MYNIWIYLLILWISMPGVVAQNYPKADSLEAVLQTNIGTQQKVDVYNQLAEYFFLLNSKKSRDYTAKAIQLAKTTQYAAGLVQAYVFQVTLLANKRQFEEAQKIAQETLSFAKESQSKSSEARAYLALGHISTKQKKWQQALTNCSRAEKLVKTINAPLLLSEAYRAKGIVYLIRQEYKQAFKYYELALRVTTKHQLFEKMAQVQKSLVYFYRSKKQYKKALEYAAEALKNGELSGDERLIAEYTALLATCYKFMGNYIKALDYHLKALKIRETFLKNHWDLAQNYNKIGVLLYEQQNYTRAIDYYAKFLAVAKHRKDARFIAIGYNNLALAYQHLKQYDKAKNYYQKSIGFAQKSNNIFVLGWAYNGLGIVAQENQQYAQAKEWFDKAIGVRKRARLLGQSYFGLGKNYQLQQQYIDAKRYYLRAADLAQKSVDLSLKRDVHEGLSICYEALGELSKALTNHQLFKKFADSLLNLENAKGITRLETSYNFQKEKDSLQFAQQRKQALLKSEIATRKANQRTTYIGLILAFGLLIVLFVFFLEKQKSNRKLNQANEQLAFSNEEIKASHEEVQSMNSTLQETLTLVSEQKNDIIASINYAERIQRAVLPADKTIKDIFPEHFIFYQPRDIVSGDFYWVAKTEAQPIYEQSADFQEGRVLLGFSSEKHVLVAADCTGHGVPGAFMTMLCSQALDSIVIQNNVCAPDEILNLLNVYLKDALKSQQTKVNDGMDIGICVVDVTEKTLTFAGAKNALLYYQNEQLHQVKGDLYSINGYAPEGYLFTLHTIPLTPSFTFYMHSDGYPDQFGGPQGKKFLATRFRQMLQEIAPLPMQQQHEQLDARLKDWMQAESQVDDVLVVGVRLS